MAITLSRGIGPKFSGSGAARHGLPAVNSNKTAGLANQVASLAAAMLQTATANAGRGSVLLINPPGVPLPDCPGLHRDEHSFGLALDLSLGPSQLAVNPQALLECSSAALPFQTGVFRVVLLSLVTENGTEPELDECCRVLMPGGELFLLGVNRRSWSGIRGRKQAGVVRMSIPRVIARLNHQDMAIEHITGIGLLGRTGPQMESNRFSAAALPFADLVLIRARHRTRPGLTRLPLKKYAAGVIPTTISAG